VCVLEGERGGCLVPFGVYRVLVGWVSDAAPLPHTVSDDCHSLCAVAVEPPTDTHHPHRMTDCVLANCPSQ